MALSLTTYDQNHGNDWGAIGIAFVELCLNDKEFDRTVPDNVFLRPMSEYDPGAVPNPEASEDDPIDLFVSLENPRVFKIGVTRTLSNVPERRTKPRSSGRMDDIKRLSGD